MTTRIKKPSGFTLLEVVFVVMILAIIGTMTVSALKDSDRGKRFEETRAKMEMLRIAILGDPDKRESGGSRSNFGYHGDMGTVPLALNMLTIPQVPAWTFVGSLGIGAGWRGPYAKVDFPDPYSIQTDAWGNAFVYSTTSITSFGSDGAAGGSSFASDLVVNIDTSLRRSRVWGVVADGTTRLSGQNVRLHFPLAGAIANSNITTDTNGFFSFTNVPFGPCAVQVTNLPGISPKAFYVDAAEVQVPNSYLNYFGSVQNIQVNTTTASCFSSLRHRVNIFNNYMRTGTLNAITVWWENTNRKLNTVLLNSVANGTGSLNPGVRIALGTVLLASAYQTVPFDLRFSSKLDTAPITAMLEWSHTKDPESISWVTSTCANPSIVVLNSLSNEYVTTATTATLNYTIPAGATLPTLVLGATAEHTTANAVVSSASFGVTPMTEVTAAQSDNSGLRSSIGMYWVSVTAGQKGTITAWWPGNTNTRTLHAYTLTSTTQTGPETTVVATSLTGDPSATITTLTDFAQVATVGAQTAASDMISTGSNHVLDMYSTTVRHASAMGHIDVEIPMTLNSIGWSAATTDDMLEVLSSFVYQP